MEKEIENCQKRLDSFQSKLEIFFDADTINQILLRIFKAWNSCLLSLISTGPDLLHRA
jgi:hypothetical protein